MQVRSRWRRGADGSFSAGDWGRWCATSSEADADPHPSGRVTAASLINRVHPSILRSHVNRVSGTVRLHHHFQGCSVSNLKLYLGILACAGRVGRRASMPLSNLLNGEPVEVTPH